MSNVRRIFVEKKQGFDIHANHLEHDLKGYLGISSIKSVRALVRYDIEGISDGDYKKALHTIFSEPPVDNIFETSITLASDEKMFAYEYLPGQYDQRADSAVQCIKMVSDGSSSPNLTIKAAQVVILKGNVSDSDIATARQYLINPVDSHEASLTIPSTLEEKLTVPDDVPVLTGFIALAQKELIELRKKLGLAMSNDDITFCQAYFRDTEKRDPSLTEIKMLDTYWSDHCRHTTFLSEIGNVSFEDSPLTKPISEAYDSYLEARKELKRTEKAVSLMDIALAGMRILKKRGMLNDIEDTHEVNACSIVVPAIVNGKTEEWLVMFKNETHNHPTEIEPFGGAATCLGGAIRDPLSGRSYVYQAMRVTGAGDPRKKLSETMKGKLPQRKICVEAAHGYSSYGNQIGLATGIVNEIYHDGYVAKRMEIGAVIAAVPRSNVTRGNPAPGDVVILVGGRTGRDGCGGATGSSKGHTAESIATCGAEVQKGNPPVERKIQRLFRNPEVSKIIKVCNDFGAGGVSVAIGELADGLVIDLDKVPKKYDGLDGTELAISESQERMAVLLSPENAARFIAEAGKENLEAIQVATVSKEARVTMMWRGKKLVDISREFINTNGVMQKSTVKVKTPENPISQLESADPALTKLSVNDAWIKMAGDLNVCSQQGLIERFDSTIGAASVLLPFGGRTQSTPAEVMAAKLPILNGDTETGTLMAHGFDPFLSAKSPFHGAQYAVIHSIAKIVAAGGSHRNIRLTLQEYFERLGTDPEKWGKPFSALLGAFAAQTAFGTPAIGGKDSMSGTFENISVPPTLVSFAMVPANVNKIISPEFKKAGNKVVIFKASHDKNGTADFAKLHEIYDKVNALISAGQIISAHTIGFGGIAAAISKMCFGNKLGFKFSEKVDHNTLFASDYGSIIAEVTTKDNNAAVIGEITEEAVISVNGDKISIDTIYSAWASPLNGVFPQKAADSEGKAAAINDDRRNTKRPSLKCAKPRIIIPVFPGTNCEYDSARAFEKAGGIAKTFIIRNMTSSDIEESIKGLAVEIDNSQIIMIPGGFSAGDEPDGSGKFITAVFRNPLVSASVMNLLKKRDGLVLGICNGFQALIKLGLVPYGEIRDLSPESPTLTFNTIGRHIS
ncbi:MAG: phosphoribosylformylglycinamidine synthase, partial [Fibrobacteres bacterium]|nr:phosphoribosylformylglycinamidine synthase [Fibrobacterota bacterium]